MTTATERFLVLGPLEVVGADGVRTVQGERQRLLLAALLAAGGATVPGDTLIELLWRDAAPANPVASLHSQVARLRRSLADVLDSRCDLVTRPPGYALTTGEDDVDARRFEGLLAQARRADPAQAADVYAQALALWRGAAYGEFADAYPAQIEAIRLEELRLAAVEERARVLVELGTPEVAIPELEAFIAGNPLREEALALLMRALYAAGLQTRALNLYQEYRTHLADELGLEPSGALRQLQVEILNHEVPTPVTGPAGPGHSGAHTRASESVDRDRDDRPPADPQQMGLQAMQVRYLRHAGHRIAYATVGSGPALVMAPAWITSLDVIASGRDPRSSLLARLAERTELTLFDRWGCGLSRGFVSDFSLAESVAELEAVLEHTGPAAVLAMSQSGPTAVTLAARRPDLVTSLVLFGTFADPADVFQNPEFADSLVGLTRSHWGMAARLLANLYRPGASSDAVRHMARVLRDSADGEVAAGYLAEMYRAEVGGLMAAVSAPALVMHYRGDRMIPFVGGQQLARELPEARLMPLDGDWHLPDAADLPRIVDAISQFLAGDEG